MKRLILLSCLLLSGIHITYSQGTTSINRQLPRKTFVSYKTEDARRNPVLELSEHYSDLAGEWEYWILGKEDKRGTITLPASGQLRTGDKVIYSDKAYPFATSKPDDDFSLPTTGAIMVFKRNFSVPLHYTYQMTYLHIGAAKSAVKVFINGDYVGYSTDSRNPAEFDISEFVKRGANTVELHVAQYSDGSLLENQSGWNLSGINREIYIFSQPKIRARDFVVRTSLDPANYTHGLLETGVVVKTELLNKHKVKVYYTLYDPDGNIVNANDKEIELELRQEDTVRFTASIPNVKRWNSETPNLYTIMYRIQREGRFTEYVSLRTGFRTVEIKGGLLQLNGKPIQIKGVNISEFSPHTGEVLTKEEIRQTLLDIKLAGFNAVRTDGYSMPTEFYDLCDEIGLYVCDVANINAQGVGESRYVGKTLANDPEWLDHFKFRVNNSYQRNKTHASVIMWGLGDNAGNGYNMYEAYMMLKQMEPVRPILYNGAGWEFNSDIYSVDNMGYDKLINEVPANSDGQPIIFSRTEFDPRIWQSDKIQGGFLTRWTAPSLLVSGKYAQLSDEYKLTDKSSGQINQTSVQDNIDEIRELFQGVVITIADERKAIFEFENRLDFTNLNELDITCQMISKGEVKKETKLNIEAKPGEKVQVEIPKGFISSKTELIFKVGNIAEQTFAM